jgi:energy-converting hydrogenase Eha subunit C
MFMELHHDISTKTSGKAFASTAFRGFAQTSTAYLLLLLPKCSICLAAYLNIFSLMGLSVAKYASWILPLLSVVIFSGLITSFLKARTLDDYRAFALLACGSLLLLADKFWLSEAYLSWISFVMILSATVVQLIQSRRVCDQDILRL